MNIEAAARECAEWLTDMLPADMVMPTKDTAVADATEAFAAILRKHFPPAWRDIETAPKDGTRILAAPHTAVGSPGWFIAHWGSGHFGGMGGMPGQFLEGWLDGPFYAGPQPTHWQPLPKPPEVKHEKEKA